MAVSFGPAGAGVRQNATIVTPGTLTYSPPLSMLYVQTAGNVTLVMEQTGTVTLTAVPAGTFVQNLSISNVTTATAGGLIGFW